MKKIWLAGLLAALGLAGCGGGGSTQNVSQGALRFITASADAPDMDVYVNGAKEVSALPYPGFSYYLNLNTGNQHVQFRPVTTGANAVDLSVPLNALQYKTVVAYNSFAHIKSMVLTDDRSVPAAGQVRLRMIDLSPSAGNIDIYINAPSVDIKNVAPTYANVPFEKVFNYTNFAAGQYRFVVTRAGSKNVQMDSGAQDLASQEVRTIMILDKQGGGVPLLALINYDLN